MVDSGHMEIEEYVKGALENDQLWGEEIPVSVFEEEFNLTWEEIKTRLDSVSVLWMGRAHHLRDLYRISVDDILGVMITFDRPKF
ncbi:hypothetical protein EU522_01820 [Candidatus Thorarchaeota archaeon]|nr:MAG: hypothetical protein EU522_01820 [Candidatus Thorarchaeota archaeon]